MNAGKDGGDCKVEQLRKTTAVKELLYSNNATLKVIADRLGKVSDCLLGATPTMTSPNKPETSASAGDINEIFDLLSSQSLLIDRLVNLTEQMERL